MIPSNSASLPTGICMGNGFAPSLFGNHLNATLEISADSIHLVDEGNPRNTILISLSPDRFRLWFNSSNSTKNSDNPIQNPQGSFHLNGEIDMSRSVNYIDFFIFPVTGSSCRGYRNASFLLLFHPVHDGSTFMDLTNLVRTSRYNKSILSVVVVFPASIWAIMPILRTSARSSLRAAITFL